MVGLVLLFLVLIREGDWDPVRGIPTLWWQIYYGRERLSLYSSPTGSYRSQPPPEWSIWNHDLSITLKERPKPFLILLHGKFPALSRAHSYSLGVANSGSPPTLVGIIKIIKWGSVEKLLTVKGFWIHKAKHQFKNQTCSTGALACVMSRDYTEGLGLDTQRISLVTCHHTMQSQGTPPDRPQFRFLWMKVFLPYLQNSRLLGT